MVARVAIDLTPELGRRLYEARLRLGYTHEVVASNGGPSSPTLTKIEAGEGRISDATARKLEAVYWWQPGSIARMATGEEPIPRQSITPEAEAWRTVAVANASHEFRTAAEGLRAAAQVLEAAATTDPGSRLLIWMAAKVIILNLEGLIQREYDEHTNTPGPRDQSQPDLVATHPDGTMSVVEVRSTGAGASRVDPADQQRSVRNTLIRAVGERGTDVVVREAESTSGQPYWIVEAPYAPDAVEPLVISTKEEALRIAQMAARRGSLVLSPAQVAQDAAADESQVDLYDEEG